MTVARRQEVMMALGRKLTARAHRRHSCWAIGDSSGSGPLNTRRKKAPVTAFTRKGRSTILWLVWGRADLDMTGQTAFDSAPSTKHGSRSRPTLSM